jgi:molybdenum-dependent DNA-binding transcriptional regulator ModE
MSEIDAEEDLVWVGELETRARGATTSGTAAIKERLARIFGEIRNAEERVQRLIAIANAAR